MELVKYMDYIKDEKFKLSHFMSGLHAAIMDQFYVLVYQNLEVRTIFEVIRKGKHCENQIKHKDDMKMLKQNLKAQGGEENKWSQPFLKQDSKLRMPSQQDKKNKSTSQKQRKQPSGRCFIYRAYHYQQECLQKSGASQNGDKQKMLPKDICNT